MSDNGLPQEVLDQAAGMRGHITSLNPIRPQNAPDAWEAEALLGTWLGAHSGDVEARFLLARCRDRHLHVVWKMSCVD